MVRPSFDSMFMRLADELSRRSHCVRQQVGAVLAKENRIISMGYNGPPAGTHNCDEDFPPGEGCPKDSKGSCSLALHAEENAILFATKNKTSLEGATLYVTLSPCLPCARMIYLMGISRVLYRDSYAKYKALSLDEGEAFLRQFGTEVQAYTENT